MIKILRYIIDMCYPKKCIQCKEIINIVSKNRYICERCMEENEYIERGCKKCGREIAVKGTMCNLCKENEDIDILESNYSVYNYEEPHNVNIYKFKLYGDKLVGEGIGEYINFFLDKENFYVDVDFVIDVPMYYKKERKRGFNQSIILSKIVGKHIKKKIVIGMLKRDRATTNQSKLNIKGRKENLKGAFKYVSKYNIEGKNILIVDDVYTSGTTIIECGRVLKEEGANKIYSLTYVIAKGKINKVT